MGSPERWKLIRHVWGEHKWFEDLQTGLIAVCDDSGTYPGESGDGPMWLDLARPITLAIPDDCPNDEFGIPTEWSEGHITVPVILLHHNTGDSGRIGGAPDEWLWVASEFGMAIEVNYQSGRPGYRFNITGSRIAARRITALSYPR